MEMRDRARRGNECAGVFRIDAAFDCVAGEVNLLLRDRQAGAGGDADLFMDQVDAGDRFGDRVLTCRRVFISMK